MARPVRITITSQLAAWDGQVNTNFAEIFNNPLPIVESAIITSLTALETAFPAATYDRCFIWINLATYGYVLCWSDGTRWLLFGNQKRAKRQVGGSTTQLITDQFVRINTAGTFTYTFLTASAWVGVTVEIRNDSTNALALDPNASELINGSATSLSLPVGGTARVYSDGTDLYAAVST